MARFGSSWSRHDLNGRFDSSQPFGELGKLRWIGSYETGRLDKPIACVGLQVVISHVWGRSTTRDGVVDRPEDVLRVDLAEPVQVGRLRSRPSAPPRPAAGQSWPRRRSPGCEQALALFAAVHKWTAYECQERRSALGPSPTLSRAGQEIPPWRSLNTARADAPTGHNPEDQSRGRGTARPKRSQTFRKASTLSGHGLVKTTVSLPPCPDSANRILRPSASLNARSIAIS